MKRLILWSLFALMFALPIRAQNPTPQQVVVGTVPDAKKAPDIRQQTFEIVWQTVKDKHFDPALGGVDWEKVRQQYQPKVAEMKSDAELYQLLQQMLGELHQSHFNIIPPEAVISDDTAEPPTGGIGIDVRIIDGAAVIVRVEPESMAEASGLRPGFVIKQVGGKTVDSLIAPLTKSTQSEAIRKLQMARRVLREINGDPGTSVAVVYADATDKTNLAVITRTKMKGELSPRLGNFPPQYTEFESKRLPGNIGYIRFNIFTTPISEKVRLALAEFHDAKGIVFDLRGNPGGVAGIATGIAGRVSEKSGILGTMKMRSGELKFAVFPQQNAYTGPLAILIDGMSASTSEVFSSGMQGLGRAIVVGETSAGACLPSYFQKLPTGALFQFAIADFKTSKGVLIEGRGVIPDLEVKWNRAGLLGGHDAQLETAIERLAQSRQQERSTK